MLRLILAASADRTGHGGLDRGGHLLGTGMKIGSAVLGGVGALLDEITGSFGNFQEVLQRVGDGGESVLDASSRVVVSVVMGSLHPQELSYGLTPSAFGPGQDCYAIVNGASQHQCCIAISRIRDMLEIGASARENGNPLSQPGAKPCGPAGNRAIRFSHPGHHPRDARRELARPSAAADRPRQRHRHLLRDFRRSRRRADAADHGPRRPDDSLGR